ncbi:hypothetical protein [Azospirillum sp.]|uniref:hypothetical protein n=1 Tax=Azospirillum sp. TaxID=34012 RepID=UPI003D743F1E
MRLEDMQRRLAGAGVGTIGTDLFVHSMPAEVMRGVMLNVGATIDSLYSMPAEVARGMTLTVSAAGDAANHEIPGYWPAASFQIIVRAISHEDGFALMERAIEAATITQPTTLGPYRINHARPRHDVVVGSRADGNGLEFTVTFDVNLVAIPR